MKNHRGFFFSWCVLRLFLQLDFGKDTKVPLSAAVRGVRAVVGLYHSRMTCAFSSQALVSSSIWCTSFLFLIGLPAASGTLVYFYHPDTQYQSLCQHTAAPPSAVCCGFALFPGGGAYLCLNCRCPLLYNLHCLKCHYYLFLKEFCQVWHSVSCDLQYSPVLCHFSANLETGPYVFFPSCCLFCSLITFISATLKIMRLLGYVKENPVLISVLISYLCIFPFLHVMRSDSVTFTHMLRSAQELQPDIGLYCAIQK